MKQVCVVTSVHKPSDNRICRQLITLRNNGFKVKYVAPEGDFSVEGIEFLPVPKAATRLKRYLFTRRLAIRKALDTDSDIYHFHDPELLVLGARAKKMGKRVIYDIHEDYSKLILKKEWIPKSIRKIVALSVEKKEKKLLKTFDGAIVVTEGLLEKFSGLTRTVILPNYPRRSEIPSERARMFLDGPVRFVYAGLISKSRHIPELIDAFRLLSEEREDVKLTLAGPIETKDISNKIEEAKTIKGFRYLGKLSSKEADNLVFESDVGVILYGFEDGAFDCSPHKFFQYLLFGLPFIATKNPYWQQMTKDHSCCIYIDDPSDITSLKDAMRKMLDSNTRKYMSLQSTELGKQYSWESVEETLQDLYTWILRKSDS